MTTTKKTSKKHESTIIVKKPSKLESDMMKGWREDVKKAGKRAVAPKQPSPVVKTTERVLNKTANKIHENIKKINELLNQLRISENQIEKKMIRRSLRSLGHRGGLKVEVK